MGKTYKTKIINLLAGPGAGKSSIAAGLIHELKKRHITCDAPYEFPKVLAWDNNQEAIKDQLYVLANQHRGIAKSYGKVEYIVVDSPILLSLVYKDYYSKEEKEYPSCLYGKEFDEMIFKMFDYYENINIFLVRSSESLHNEGERYQDLEQSKGIDEKTLDILETAKIPYTKVNVDEDPIQTILKLIIK